MQKILGRGGGDAGGNSGPAGSGDQNDDESSLTAFEKAKRHFQRIDSSESLNSSSLSRSTSHQNFQAPATTNLLAASIQQQPEPPTTSATSSSGDNLGAKKPQTPPNPAALESPRIQKRSQTVDSLANGLVAARISQWVQFDAPPPPTQPESPQRQSQQQPQTPPRNSNQQNPFISPLDQPQGHNPFQDDVNENPFESSPLKSPLKSSSLNPFEDQPPVSSSSFDDYFDDDSSDEGDDVNNDDNTGRASHTASLNNSTRGKPALPPRPVSVRSSAPADLTPSFKPPLPARPSRLAISPQPSQPGSSASLMSHHHHHHHGQPPGKNHFPDIPTVYPETFNASRYPPFASGCIQDLAVKAPVTCLASSRGYIVTGSVGGFRIWNMNSGECVHACAKSGEMKASAIAFLPSYVADVDGRFFWVGFSDGDLWMVDVFTGNVLERRVSVHNHRILHILRLQMLMLTIDENGIMQLWSDFHQDSVSAPLFSSTTGMERSAGRSTLTLEGKPKTFRIAAGQEVATVVNFHVWTGHERTIEVLAPIPVAAESQAVAGSDSIFKSRIDIPSSIGHISCATAFYKASPLPGSIADLLCADSVPDTVYTGHVDGKILEWDAQTFAKRRIFDTGSYRLVRLQSLSPKLLWVCIGTGKALIFDVVNKFQEDGGVTVVKEWWPEQKETVEFLHVDIDSIIHSGQLIVTGATKNGHVQIWDALFPQDYIQSELQRKESEFCEYRSLNLLICSWNIDANKPDQLLARADDAYFLDKWVTTSFPEGADILVFGLQELVDLESKSVAAKGFWRKKTTANQQQLQHDHESRARSWRDRLAKALKDNFKVSYRIIDSRNMVGLFTCLFIREDLMSSVSHVESMTVSTGMGGTYGNKGGIVTRLSIDTSSFCFITSHLPAHQNKIGKRNVDAWTILRSGGLSAIQSDERRQLSLVRGGDGTQILDYENIFFFGDLNYRIDLDRDVCVDLINRNEINSLLQADQLIRQRSLPNSTCLLRLFNEASITFTPTYKYDPGTDTYDSSEKRRVPAYCDRILYRDSIAHTSTCLMDHNQRSRPQSRIQPLEYRRFECKISDHRPIACSFKVTVKKLADPQKRVAKQVAIEGDFGRRKHEYMWDGQIRWLMERTRIERPAAESILKQTQGDHTTAVNIIRNLAK